MADRYLGNRPAEYELAQFSASLRRFISFTAPWRSDAWNNVQYSSSTGTIDISAAFGDAPADTSHVLAWYVRLGCQDSAAFGSRPLSFGLGNASYLDIVRCVCYGNNLPAYANGIVPCTAAGDMTYQIVASGTNTMTVFLDIWGAFV